MDTEIGVYADEVRIKRRVVQRRHTNAVTN